ncbi:MAG: succinylglutamate desuccinylase/aspartoacylase family protein [Leeuwenhoekiella sp.]
MVINKDKFPRIIGEYSCGNKGPLLFITAGVHGNEPSGVKALKKVFSELENTMPDINGTVVGVTGNRKALQKNVRYIDEDLNRTWTVENVKSKHKDTHEKDEMFSIINELNNFPEKDFTKRYFLDCHTTSAASAPYISVQEVDDNDAWAHEFAPFIIRGFSDIVSGCIDHYMSRTGLTGFVFEGGQHISKEAIDNHEGLIWHAIAKACDLDLNNLSNYPESAKKLEQLKSRQKTFEIVYRHAIHDSDDFEMEPGYENFQPIKKGEILAHHNDKKVISDWDAFIFMPLYQSQGNDGFFVVEQV